MILIIDNYDSFVFNLARYVQELGFTTKVLRNDRLSIAQVRQLNPAKIIISPGPCDPDKAGISLDLIRHLGPEIPILGVCLGHQAIGQAYGGKVVRALKPVHGKSSLITHNQQGLFQNIPNPLKVGRYHSLIVDKISLPTDLEITAVSEEGEIMALAHKEHQVYGLQFHPESIITEQGHRLLANFCELETNGLALIANNPYTMG